MVEKPKKLKRIVKEESEAKKRRPIVKDRTVEDIIDLQQLPLETIEDYKVYNDHARKLRMPVKVPPDSMHPQWEVKFQRFDQPENVLKYRLCTAEIDTQGQLIPGKTYTLPKPVVLWLNDRNVPVFAQVDVNDGGPTLKETRQVGERARFSCQFIKEVEVA